jgi:uncharacterized protein YcnI
VVATAALAAVWVPTAAVADVTVTPATGVHGSALKLVFRVTEDRPSAHTKTVELRMPQATPVAEVYPISVPDWAPKMSMRTLDRPIASLHGIGTKDVVASITWIRVTAPKVGQEPAWDLPISLGPLPRTDRLVFTVIQTYSDGTVVHWADPPTAGGTPGPNAAPVVTLRSAEPGSGLPGGGPIDGRQVPDLGDEAPASSAGYAIFLTVVIAGVAAGLLWAGWVLWQRQRGIAQLAPPDESNTDSDKSAGERPIVDHDVRA